jgi:hypothetical protein
MDQSDQHFREPHMRQLLQIRVSDMNLFAVAIAVLAKPVEGTQVVVGLSADPDDTDSNGCLEMQSQEVSTDKIGARM